MSKVLTISVAAYNMEKYIKETLESLVVPEVIDDIEVFVVDDGGTDGTMRIAEAFQEKYPETFKLVHKENGGYGSTVNYSIANASGEYFKLLDGDDWFEKDGLKRLVEELRRSDADVIVTPMKRGADKSDLYLSRIFDPPVGKVIQVNEYIYPRQLGMWVMTYKTDVLRKSGLILPEHTLYTDQIYCTVPFNTAKTMQFFDFYVYCYRIGRDGQSVSPESRLKHIKETLDHCEFLTRFCAEQSSSDNYNYICFRVAAYFCAALRALLLLPISKESLIKIKDYEKLIDSICHDVYLEVVNVGGMGKLVKYMRLTHYSIYWLLKFVPKSKINWI